MIGDGNKLQLAGRGRRLAATLVDMVLVPALTIFLVMVADVVEDAEDFADSWWVLWVFVLAVASYLLLNGYTLWRRGQTLGKKLFGIAIVQGLPVAASTPNSVSDVAAGVDQASQRLDFVPAPWWKLICIRALFFPLLFLAVIPPLTLIPLLDQGFIWGKRRRCLHDWAANTSVVKL